MNWRPNSAMILGAGLGTRMRPLTEKMPKPMVPFHGRPLIDHILDRMDAAGINEVVVNVHYLADVLEDHLATRTSPKIKISDERNELLDTGGGLTRALPLLGETPFLIHNSDSLSHETHGPNLDMLFDAWQDDAMDTLLVLAPISESLGYDGAGDFELGQDGRITRPLTSQEVNQGASSGTSSGTSSRNGVPYVFTGLSLIHPRLFKDAPTGPFSLNKLWTKAMAEGRAYGILHKGLWMHIGTPEALLEAEEATAK